MRELRDIIYLIEQADETEAFEPAIVSPLAEQEDTISIKDRLADLAFKMRAHSEPLVEGVQGDYCLGVETGLEMAAEMLDNLLRELDQQ